MADVRTEALKLVGDFTDSVATWNRFLIVLNSLPNTTILSTQYHPFEGGGFSGVVIIGESHSAIHTWPEINEAWVVLSTCGGAHVIEKFYEQISNLGKVVSKRWFHEQCIKGITAGFEIEEVLFSERSQYQLVEVFQTPVLGRVLALDRIIQTTEFDQFAYHEMLVHVPMVMHPHPKNVLVIGGGDGGAARAVLRHHDVSAVHHVEIDGKVTSACADYLPSIKGSLEKDDRYNLIIDDGLKYLLENDRTFDVIITDLTDPIGPAEHLDSHEFYQAIHQALTNGGLMSEQSGSPFYQPDHLRSANVHLREHFSDHKFYVGAVPTYPGGFHAYAVAKKGGSLNLTDGELEARVARFERENPDLQYYTSDIHKAAFNLPKFMQKLVGGKTNGMG